MQTQQALNLTLHYVVQQDGATSAGVILIRWWRDVTSPTDLQCYIKRRFLILMNRPNNKYKYYYS